MRTTPLLAALLGVAPAFAAEPAGTAVKPLVVLSGADSRTAQPTFARAADDAAWAKLWLGHLGKTPDDIFREHLPAVAVDFDTCMVVALFHGPTTNCRGLEIASVTDGKDAVTVRYERQSYQTAGPPNGGPAPVNRSTPYAFVVLPKSPKVVVVEEGVRHLKDEPTRWKERARLPAGAAAAGAFDLRDADGNVLVAADDIRAYDWATHTLTLAPKVRAELGGRLARRLVAGVPFAVSVGGEAVYRGNLTTCLSSRSLATLVAVVDAGSVDPSVGDDQLRLQLGYPTAGFFKGDDPRGNVRVEQVLKAAGKLK